MDYSGTGLAALRHWQTQEEIIWKRAVFSRNYNYIAISDQQLTHLYAINNYTKTVEQKAYCY